jgi:colanic acid biosynthesis glycosyl transferase WcaI
MVKRWRRFLEGPNGRWRLEGRSDDAIAPPRFRRVAGPVRAPRAPRRILFINQYYWPDHASTAQHLADLAESLAQEGYDCHVVCSRGAYQGASANLPGEERHNGVTIHRLPASALGRRNTLCRLADYLSFYLLALLHSLALPKFDVVATLTTPPLIGLVGTVLRRLKGSVHVCWSMDLHPDASLVLGRMSARNPMARTLARLSNLVYRRADKVVVLGPYMADRVGGKQVRPDRLATIPVWSRRDEVYPLPRDDHPLRKALGLGEKFVIMYSGNHGLAHAFEEFLEAARRLSRDPGIVFLFVGDGPRRAEVVAAKERSGLENVVLLDYFPRAELFRSLSLADVHLISMRREMTGVVVPGKLYGAMASGRPTVFVGPEHCEPADTIRESGCGFTIRLGDVNALVESLTHLASDPELAGRLGDRGREAFLAQHEKDVCCARWSALLGELCGATRPATNAFADATAVPPQMSGSY